MGSELKSQPTMSLKDIVSTDNGNNTITINLEKLFPLIENKTLIINGLDKILFTQTVELESSKHIALTSGWKRSHNYYKVLVNNDYLPGETPDEYVERLLTQQSNTRIFPKRAVRMRKSIRF